MAADKTIQTITAIDIEKYHKGQLTPREMHALEKAALDDPFLADALEGYGVTGVSAAADKADLDKKLSERIEKNKKTFLFSAARPFPWLKAAAMAILVAGAAFAVYQAVAPVKQDDIAQAKVTSTNAQVTEDSPSIASPGVTTDQADSNLQQKETASTKLVAPPDKAKDQPRNNAQKDIPAITDNEPETEITDPASAKEKEAKEEEEEAKKQDDNNTLAKAVQARKREDAYKADSQAASIPAPPQAARQKAFLAQEKARKENNRQSFDAHVFRGRVTDAHNNALPFANITNTADQVGTYADAKGNFILTSPDSVLNVQVRSIGFENNTVQLQNAVPDNQVVMQEDTDLAEVVISNKRANSNRSRSATMILEEPEPVDGWTNYDTYLANNLIVPETLGTKTRNGEVELSFEVNTRGEPTNIAIEKSLCESCDREAIRLVREGPKWKRKSRNGRTFVTIPF